MKIVTLIQVAIGLIMFALPITLIVVLIIYLINHL